MLARVTSSLIRFLSRLSRLSRRSRVSAFVFGAATVLVGSGSVLGCGTQCDRNPDEPPIVWKGGLTNRATGTYFSSDVRGPYLPFPPGRTYRFMHQLGGVPEDVQIWFSFAEGPVDAADPDGFVPATGNQATVERVTGEYVDVRNDTCSDVRIRFMARDPLLESESQSDAAGTPGTPKDGGP
jgi:hypothetical protein